MGTSSMIGIWDSETGKVTASYCHYDGYIEHNGAVLAEHYSTPEAADKVATGGYISGLSENYSRSRQEAVHNEPAVVYKSVEDYLATGADYASAEYLYLFDGDIWFFASWDAENFSPIEEVEMNLKATV